MTSGRTIANDVVLSEVCALVASGKRIRLRAKGDSMRPFIRGDEDIIELSQLKPLRIGDIVMARITEGEYVIHRVVYINGDNVQLAGDANLYKVENCLRRDICALVIAIVRQGCVLSLDNYKTRVAVRLWRWLLPLRRILWRIRCFFK